MSLDRQFIYNFVTNLEKEDNYISGEVLCKLMNVSSRTLRNKIRDNEKYFHNYGFSVISKTKLGYQLIIDNKDKYINFKNSIVNYNLYPIYKEERVSFLLRELLTLNDYIKIADLEEILHVSKYTLTQDLKEIKKYIMKYNLEIDNKPYHGIKIIGNEINKRSCLSNCIGDTDLKRNIFEDRHSEVLKIIENIVKSVLDKNNFVLTDIGFKNLILHIFLGINRANIQCIQSGLEIDKDQREYKIAKEIFELINMHFHIDLPLVEIDYITIHLLSKQLLNSKSQAKILPETQIVLEKVLESINTRFNFDFSKDLDLFTLLLLHFQPMFQRLKYNLTIDNPLLEEIKNNNNLAFEIALLAGKVIGKEMKCNVSVDECGYLALHFALALERYKTPILKRNVLVVCASGRGTSQLLLSSIRKRFYDKIEKIDAISVFELKEDILKSYDMILTTIPLDLNINKPILQIPYFIKENDYMRINDAFLMTCTEEENLISQCFDENAFFLNIKGKNQEEVLKCIISELNKSFEIPDNLYDLLMEREEIYSTEYGNGFALPHPIVPMFYRDLIVFARLEKSIIWKNKKVKYIFVLLFNKKSSSTSEVFNDVLSRFIQNESLINKIGENSTYNYFIGLINSILKKTNKNLDDIFNY